MLRKDLTATNIPKDNVTDINARMAEQPAAIHEAVQRLDIQQSLDVLEELILDSPPIPFSRRVLADEDKLLEQLDRIRLNLPSAFQEALQIIQHRDRIVGEAEQYAHEIINAADQEATRRINDLGIVQQAETQASQVRQQVQQDCNALRSQALSEIEQWQQAAQEHWDQMKRQAEAECQALKQEADVYAAQMLQQLEQQLTEMLRVVHNGRQSVEARDTAIAEGSGRPQAASSTRKVKALPQPEANRSGRLRNHHPQ